MSETKRKGNDKVRAFVFAVVAFFLACILFLLSACITLRLTFFSNDYMKQVMAEHEYYNQVKDELKTKLTSLSHASGLDEEFVDKFVDSLDLNQEINDYVDGYYNSNSTLIDTISFKQKFRAAIDDYVEEHNIEKSKVSESSVEYLMNEATEIYQNEISIPFFSVAANYIKKLSKPLDFTMFGLIAGVLVLCVIVYFTNSFKHRAFRYFSYAFGGAAISCAVIPAVVYISGVIEKINISTRSLYNLFVNYFNGAFVYFWFFVAAYLILSVASFLVFKRKHDALVRGHH